MPASRILFYYATLLRRLIDELEDSYDVRLAEERLAQSDGHPISMSEMATKLGISTEDLENAPDNCVH